MKHSLNFGMGTIMLCSWVYVSARALDDLHISVKDVVLLSCWQPVTVWGQVPLAWFLRHDSIEQDSSTQMKLTTLELCPLEWWVNIQVQEYQ